MKIQHAIAGIAGVSLLAGAMTASAAEKIAPKTLEFLESTQISGYVQASYQRSWNTENGSPGLTPTRGFNPNRNSFDVDQVKITLEKPLDESDYAAGYRIDMLYGSNVRNWIGPATYVGPNREGTGSQGVFDSGMATLEQAYVQFRLPVGNGVEVKFGKFVTLAGMEVIDAPANQNYSHSYNFLYGIPFTHTGALLSYKFNKTFDAQLAVVNGWDSLEDNNSFKTLMGRVGVTLMDGKLVFSTVAIGGPERNSGINHLPTGGGNDSDYRWVVDETVTYQVNEKLSVGLDGVYGEERFSFQDGAGQSPTKDAHWWGIAGYAKYQVTPHVSTAARVEYFSDDGGSRLLGAGGLTSPAPGVATSSTSFGLIGQNADVQEYTLSAQLDNVWKNLTPRLELRYDHINRAVLGGGGSAPDALNDQQQSVFSVSLDFIYTF